MTYAYFCPETEELKPRSLHKNSHTWLSQIHEKTDFEGLLKDAQIYPVNG